MSNYSQSLIEDYKQTIERLQKECTEKTNAIIALGEQLKVKEQECESLKEKYEEIKEDRYNLNMEMYTFDRYRKALEELKKEIINKNEKIKELRFSVSDLTNRLCYLNAEKSFRIVGLEQALDEIKSICLKDVHTFADGTQLRYDSLDEILNIINKAKGEGC